MRALVIDDHALFADGIALLIREMDASISTEKVASCEAASALWADTFPPINLILLDWTLRGRSGLDAVQYIKQNFPDARIVIISSSEDKATVLTAIEAGAMGFVPKSYPTYVMYGALNLVLTGGVYLPPTVFLGEPYVFDQPPALSTPILTTSPSALGLTGRQIDVLAQILNGRSSKSISQALGLSLNTVKTHTSAVLRALNVTTRTQAIIAASRLGLAIPLSVGKNRAL